MINYYKKNQEINERNYIYVLKFFAVISIVSAHVATISNQSSLNILASNILTSISSFGVAIFFLISGYLFYSNSNNIRQFFLKKIINIAIPWIMTGTLVFLYIALRKGGLNIGGWLNFLLGNGSYLYYLTLLSSFYIVFWKYRNKIIILGSFILFIISLTLTANGLLEGINPYLNPFNFIGYFALGLFIRSEKYSLLEIGNIISSKKILVIIAFFIVTILINKYNITSGYFGNATIISQFVTVLMILSISLWKNLYNDLFISIGKESFAIYLLHMPIAGIIVALTNLIGNGFVTLIRPIIVIAIVYTTIVIYKKTSVLTIKQEYKNMLIGSR